MEFHARTYSSLAEQIQAIRERRSRPGFKVTRGSKEPGRIDATVRPPVDDEVEERTYRPRETKEQEMNAGARTFDEHVKDYRSHIVRFGGAPAKAYVFYRCQELMLPYAGVTGHTRISHIVTARQMLMWEVKRKFNLAQTEIGRLFGRDHTTVLHAVRKVQTMIDSGRMKNPLAVNSVAMEAD